MRLSSAKKTRFSPVFQLQTMPLSLSENSLIRPSPRPLAFALSVRSVKAPIGRNVAVDNADLGTRLAEGILKCSRHEHLHHT
jgi:hypothetical protein